MTFAEIQKLLKNYRIGNLVEFSEITQGIDNSNFIIKTTQGKFILTLFEKRIKSQELPFFIELKSHLAKNGICCPVPMLNKDQEKISEIKGKKALIVTFLRGSMLEPCENGLYDKISVKNCEEVGKILAKAHNKVIDFNLKRENDLGFLALQSFYKKFSDKTRDYDGKIADEISKVFADLSAKWDENLPKGACHLDLFPDNVFFNQEGEVSGLIDFYFAADDLFVYDFAVTVSAWCFDEKNRFDVQKFKAMKKSYEKIREFSEKEEKFLKTALIAASLRFLLTRLHDLFFTEKGSNVVVKDPKQYYERLEFFKNEYSS